MQPCAALTYILAQAAVLDAVHDVFYLTPDELQNGQDVPLKRFVQDRKIEMERFRRVTPPSMLGTAPAFELTGGGSMVRALLKGEMSPSKTSNGEMNRVKGLPGSAVGEESITASFAGQHETYLNIVGTEAIIQAVMRCWESARSERALEYRRQQGLSAEHPQIAVLVQQLVAADAAAVVFSAKPLTGSRDS